jgi:polyribonucleotide nucleotidyltransferase
MGLVSDGERNAILTDIQGVEDQLGDMDALLLCKWTSRLRV